MKRGTIVRYIGHVVSSLHGRRGTVASTDRKGWAHVAFGKAEPVKCSQSSIEPDDGTAFFNLACPDCGRSDKLDISAIVCVRIVGTVFSADPETDADEADDRSHEWDNDSGIACRACDFSGLVGDCQPD